ncbi:MAG TPA: PilN domain-containing protein [Candidatus Manganitrophaceae bacterium]|nr:PilN domain-containing protein [Candidatus Manganitrophaceae bacterium]
MKEHINLLQLDVLEGKGRSDGKLQGALLPLALLLLAFLGGAFYALDGKERTALKREVSTILQQRDQLRQQIASFAAAPFSGGKVKEDPALSVLKKKRVWSEALEEISLTVPEGVWMTQFEAGADEGVRFEGFAVSHQKITALISALERSSVFQDVLLDFSRQNPSERRVEFSIHARFRKPV